MSFVLKIISFTKHAKNRTRPTQNKAKNIPHAKLAFAIFIERGSLHSALKLVVTDFRDGFETGTTEP